MIPYKDALVLAQKQIGGLPPIEDCVWVLRDGKRVEDGWYFDHAFDPLPGKERPMVGGAPGFLILDDGSARVVSWSELRTLRIRNEN